MAVLGTMFAGSYLAMGGGSKPKTAAGPPINASSKEEGDFIQYVLAIYPNIPDNADNLSIKNIQYCMNSSNGTSPVLTVRV